MKNLREKLIADGIMAPHHMYNTRDLNRLSENIETEEDYQLYLATWSKYRTKYRLKYIMTLFIAERAAV